MKPEALRLLIDAGNPIISMDTPDEPRAIRVVQEVAPGQRHESCAVVGDGGTPLHASGGGETLVEPGKVAAARARR